MSVGEPVHPLPDLGEVVVHVRRPVVPRLLQQRQPAVGALLITGPGLTLSSSDTTPYIEVREDYTIMEKAFWSKPGTFVWPFV